MNKFQLHVCHRFCIGTLTYNALLPVQRFFSPFWTRRRRFQRTTEKCHHTEYEEMSTMDNFISRKIKVVYHRNCYRKYTSKQNCSVFKTDQIIFYKYCIDANHYDFENTAVLFTCIFSIAITVVNNFNFTWYKIVHCGHFLQNTRIHLILMCIQLHPVSVWTSWWSAH
jgi:hypothetical protein